MNATLRGAGVLVLCLLASCGKDDGRSFRSTASGPLLIAPMLEAASFCQEAVDDSTVSNDDDAAFLCASKHVTGASRISEALHDIGPKTSPSGRFELGYTLSVPLFRYFRLRDGRWTLDTSTLNANLQVISEVDRRVVVYLSSNHFTDAGAKLSAELARDARNLMWNATGPLVPDDYFNHPVIAWTLSDPSAPITRMRKQAFRAALDAICALPEASRGRIAAVSVLGEVHDLFPGLMRGPGFNVPVKDVTDYSPLALLGFREWLARRYRRIEALNSEMGSSFTSFDEVDPPSRDIRQQPLSSFFEHIDAYAAGRVPVHGWINDARNRALTVTVLLDGKVSDTATTALSRTDVIEALPGLKNPNVGFRYDLDFRSVPVGIHVLEVMVSVAGAKPLLLSRRDLVVVDRTQSTPSRLAQPASDAEPMSSDTSLSGYLDGPAPDASILYNPLARLWLEYRNQVVRNYVEQFADIAGQSCIPKDKIFSHQVTPALTPNWNGDLFAADASKLPSSFYAPGTTLYGGAAFSPAFARMKRDLGWNRYGVGELHPIAKLTAAQYQGMFEMHRTEGAEFVAPYYLSLTPSRIKSASALTRFRLASDNRTYGSDAYLQSIKNIMKQ